ncbi:MAG: FAD-dependent oxidoreductase [Proteobacteria bacterium]|nr:FAD-dependent oxidoreductase [Pseudomonadota bacterium]MDA1022498.1 FAD-dependent oxidoreductase [Pseudomonadota bacterium]
MPVSVAIVGSGPAGVYTADALVASGADISVDIIERLPSPFGLIRAGVAPDHQTTKNITKKYAKTLDNEKVRYFGNVEVGRDISLAALREIYDAVVLAIGAPLDRNPGIPGQDKAGVYGSADFVGWYNGHPDFIDLGPDLNVAAAAVIGIGNVAIDVARLLVRTKKELAEADIPDYAEDAILKSAIKDVHIFGRRGPVEAKFTNVELREMGDLENAELAIDTDHIPADAGDLPDRDKRLKERNLETLRQYSEMPRGDKPKTVHFGFYASPVEILGGEKVEGIRLERTAVENGKAIGSGEFFEINCGLVVTATGYRSGALEGAPFDEKQGIVPNDDGRVDDGLYAVGWVKRGPSGVISSNRPDGKTVAGHILADVHGKKPGRGAFKKHLQDNNVRFVSLEEWKKIDAAEISNAQGSHPRKKFITVQEMLDALN